MMRNKKGWIRIVEAFIAILIVASVLFVITSRVPIRDRTEEIHETQRFVLEQIATNNTLRGEILEGNKDNSEIFIENNIPTHWNFTVEICEVDNICGMPFYVEEEVYADEILITSNLTKYSPKKLKLFVWSK